ncbi:MAG: UbiA family prenyltransferase [Rhizobiales bacterium]|nr:UbiA family prenyltransferase [Hyphomicrobiales bacterium]
MSYEAAVDLPLAVDLDGTLTPSDTLHEGVLVYLKQPVREVVSLWGPLRSGKAEFKRTIAARIAFDPSLLPYNQDVLAWLRAERKRGRCIVLFSAADQSIAEAVAEHLGLFDAAYGSRDGVNLSGARKLALIRSVLGERFVYAGDGAVDAPIFAQAERVVLVGPVPRLERLLPPGKEVERRFPVRRPGLRTWLHALRVQHWAKNVLVFLAPVLGFHSATPLTVVQSLLLFLAFGLLASATYLLNDLLDLSADRQHPRKRFRPLAAGLIAPRDGVIAAAVLLGITVLLAACLPVGAGAVLLLYLVVTLVYSLFLKRQPIIDTFVLAGLFTIRVLAGSMLLPTAVSPWLLTFSMFFFLGLAMVKRYAELNRVVQAGGAGVVSRGYTARDLPLLLAAGVASSFGAIVIFVFYLIEEQYPSGLYQRPEMLWAMMPAVLIWSLRVWHLTVHGRMNEDPVVFALRDSFSRVLGGICCVILLMAWL